MQFLSQLLKEVLQAGSGPQLLKFPPKSLRLSAAELRTTVLAPASRKLAPLQLRSDEGSAVLASVSAATHQSSSRVNKVRFPLQMWGSLPHGPYLRHHLNPFQNKFSICELLLSWGHCPHKPLVKHQWLQAYHKCDVFSLILVEFMLIL